MLVKRSNVGKDSCDVITASPSNSLALLATASLGVPRELCRTGLQARVLRGWKQGQCSLMVSEPEC